MFLAMLVAWAVAASIPALGPLFRGSSEPLGLVLGAAAIFVVGLIDDVRDMSAPAKVAGAGPGRHHPLLHRRDLFQFKVPLAGLVVLSPGVDPAAHRPVGDRHHQRRQPHRRPGRPGRRRGGHRLGAPWPSTGCTSSTWATCQADNIGPLIAVITCGICLGFLPHNFHPAKVFMGDAGALLLGLLMAASTMLIGGRSVGAVGGVAGRSGQTYFFFAPLFIPFFILGVPIVDMAFAFVRRTANRTGFSTPDKNHLHHRLLRLGHGHRRSVLILWAWTASCCPASSSSRSSSRA